MHLIAAGLFAAFAAVTALAAFARASILVRDRQRVAMRFGAVTGATPLHRGWRDGTAIMLERLGRILTPKARISGLRNLLQQAGYGTQAAPHVFTAARVVLALGLGTTAFFLRERGHGAGLSVAWTVFLTTCLSYRLAVTALRIAAERRARAICRELPHVIDVVLMVLDSGVSIDQGLRYAAGVLKPTAPVCTSVLARYATEIETGLAYDIALDRLGARLGIEEGHDLASLIKQSLFQGGELGQPLRRFAADLTDARLAFAREQIGRRSTQLTLVMLVFFMPVLFIVLGGPAVSQLSSTLGHVAHGMRHQDMDR